MKTKKTSMDRKFILLLITGICLFFASCKKDNPDPVPAPIIYPEQNPIPAYRTASGFDQQITPVINSSSFEFGIRFTPTVKGKINSIIVRIPDTRAGLRVTIWDAATKAILRTETIDVITAGLETVKSITPLQLLKDTEYLISMNSNDWYYRTRTDMSAAPYPIIAGDLKITGFGNVGGNTQSYPTTFETKQYSGDLSFMFQRTE
jgi:hypothetical protein